MVLDQHGIEGKALFRCRDCGGMINKSPDFTVFLTNCEYFFPHFHGFRSSGIRRCRCEKQALADECCQIFGRFFRFSAAGRFT